MLLYRRVLKGSASNVKIMGLRSQSAGKKQSVSIIIPTLNEEEAIGRVLSLIPYRELEQVTHVRPQVIVIDGGSSDGTIEIVKALGASVKTQTKLGYGRAIKEAIPYAEGEILVVLDGDGVYDPREIPKLLKIMKEENADLVIGSRFLGEIKPETTPVIRLLGNKLMNLFFSLLLGKRITDAFSGFIVVRKTVVSKLERLQDPVAEPTQPDIIAEVHLRHGKVVEAPITFYSRIGRYKLNPLLGSFRLFFSILKLTRGGWFS